MPLSEAQPDALAEVYARSVFELAEAKGGQAEIESIAGEFEALLELARSDGKFGEFLASRVLPVADRARSLDAIFKGRVHDLTLRFLHILNEKGRLYHLPAIAAAYDAVVQKRFGRVEVDVYTTAPLESGELRDVKGELQKALGREPVIHNYTDATMIGGIKLQIGDRLIDASLATQLRRMREQLATSGGAQMRAKAERLIDGAGGL